MSNDIRKALNSNEKRAIMYVASLDARLSLDCKCLEKRLKSVPDLWRQYRIAMTAIDKVVDGLYSTIPKEGLLSISRMCDNSDVVLQPKNELNRSSDIEVAHTDDLRVLINETMKANCAMCLKEGAEIRKCPIRKALTNIAPPTEFKAGVMCNYAYVAANNNLGEYI